MDHRRTSSTSKINFGANCSPLARPTGSRGFTFVTTKRRNQPLREYQKIARYCRRSAERRMLKHVSVSPWRGRADSVSLASSSASSCGSGSPTPAHTPPPSRASSCASLAPLNALSSFSPADNNPQQTTIKVYANCLRPDIEYKTLSISYETTCREVVQNLLNKYRMRHRDPRLFYLTMEVTVRRANVRTVLPLDEDARPAVLQSCHPPGDSRFSLQTRRGGLVKIYDSALMSGSKYKSLLVSEYTTVDELIQMLLSCYSSSERVEQFSLYEVCEGEEYQRKLHPDDSPLKVTQRWTSVDRHLRIRRNPDYNPHRRKSMWASDSSITMAMSKLQLHSNLQNHHQLHHHHHHHHHQNNHQNHNYPAHLNHNNNNNNNNNHHYNNNNNNKNNNNNIGGSSALHQQRHMQVQQINNNKSSHVQIVPVQQSRIVVPHVSQIAQSVSTAQLNVKHLVSSASSSSSNSTTSSSSSSSSTNSSSSNPYADYENYFYI